MTGAKHVDERFSQESILLFSFIYRTFPVILKEYVFSDVKSKKNSRFRLILTKALLQNINQRPIKSV